MKVTALKSALIVSLTLLMVLPAISQKGIEDGSKYGKGQDSINCIKNLSLYKEFYKHSNFGDAINPWREVFGNCPSSSEKMYVEGVSMYRKFIEQAQTPERKDELIDTLMLIYERRMEYFPSKNGSTLGRQGVDLLRFRTGNVNAMETAYGYLVQSVKAEGSKSRDLILLNVVSTSINLNKADRFDDGHTIEDYFMVTQIIDKNLSKSSRWKKAKASVDEMMLNSGLLTCEALDSYFGPQWEESKEDQKFLEKVIDFYTQTGCDRADMYIAASEQMYVIEPGPKSAHQLAVLFISRQDYPKASKYLKEAVQAEDVENDVKAEWYYELALVTRAQEVFCEAIIYAREAITLNNGHGKAYILLGDCYILSRENLGDAFQQKAAYWAATDKYRKAKSVDPSVADDASKKLKDYSGLFPKKSDVFFNDLSDGSSYKVGGCINEMTTVRSIAD